MIISPRMRRETKGLRHVVNMAGAGCSAWAVALCGVTMATPAYAADASHRISVRAGPLDAAIVELAEELRVSILIEPRLAANRRSAGLQGVMSTEEALTRLLRDSGLTFYRNSNGGYIVVKADASQVSEVRPAPSPVQPQAAMEESDSGGVEEIIVTALRRETTLQDTAIAVAAVSGERLDALGVNSTSALQLQIPGLVISTNTAGQSQIYIRGVGNTITGVVSSNSVATYLDGVYIANGQAALQTFNDIARVEVLKGPQSTLYGRNATGGAVVLVSKEPSDRPEYSVSGLVGNYEAYRVQASLNGPLRGDEIMGRLSFFAQGHKGYAENVTLGTHPGGDRQWGVKGALKLVPSDSLDVTVRGDFRRIRGGDYIKHLNPNSYVYLTSAIPNQYIDDPWKYRSEIRASFKGYDTGGSAQLRWRSDIGKVTSVTSYRRFSLGPQFSDFDSIVGFFAGTTRAEMFGETVDAKQFWHETIFQSPEDRNFQIMAGASYFSGRSWQEVRRISTGNTVGSARRSADNRAGAAFIDARYDFSPRFSAVGGVRYTREHLEYAQLVRITTAGVGPGRAENARTWSALSPRFGLEWRPSEGRLLYFNVTSGFKSGGFNETNPLNAFEPEKVWAFEGGVKTTWLDGKVQANASAFTYAYRDLQVSRIAPITQARVVANAGRSRISGADIDLVVRPVRAVSLGASLSLLKSEFGDLVLCDNVAGPCSLPPNDSGFVNIKGRQLNNAPNRALSLFTDLSFTPPGLPGQMLLHLDGNYRSRVYFTPFARKEFQSDPGNWLLNAELKYEWADRQFVALFVRNVTDEVRVDYASASGVLRTPSTSATAIGTSLFAARLQPPRTFGLRAGYTF
ncbi:TonB-dependent receptor domain-containing protein [Rhizorhabdus dicambivorans]|nr:TonB-dependent receptor [Rhizorhabdus dicambivorans]